MRTNIVLSLLAHGKFASIVRAQGSASCFLREIFLLKCLFAEMLLFSSFGRSKFENETICFAHRGFYVSLPNPDCFDGLHEMHTAPLKNMYRCVHVYNLLSTHARPCSLLRSDMHVQFRKK